MLSQKPIDCAEAADKFATAVFLLLHGCAGRLENSAQGPPGSGERVDACGDIRIFNQRRRVVRFASGIDDQTAAAAPMFILDITTNSIDVDRWIGACECDP